MRFWDASALTPLLVPEAWSPAAEGLARSDRAMVVWWGTRVECSSALRRRERAGALSAASVQRSFKLLEELASDWSEVAPVEAVRARAERALAVHALRAADALQLAAVLTWRGEAIAPRELVSFDDRLRDAASREGFSVLPGELPATA